MDVNFYTFSKRRNSTGRPTTSPVVISCNLKDSSSILSPQIELQAQDNPTAWNYAYIPAFKRYYYCSEWTYYRGVWTAFMSCDVLASWKDNILASKALVVYSSSAGVASLLDNRFPVLGSQNRNIETVAFVGAALSQAQTVPQGTFCLTALDNTGIWSTGATTTYFMTYKQMQAFAQELINPGTWDSLKQFWDNPMDGIVDCYYLPFDISSYIDLTVERSVVVGSYTFPTAKAKSAQASNLAVKSQGTTINIPWQYTDFRNLPPYSQVELFVPFCGSKPLPAADLYGFESFIVNYSIDVGTGAVQCIAFVKQTVLQEWSGNCKVTLPLGQSQSRAEQIIGAVGGAVGAAAGIATGNVAGAAAGVLAGIGSVISPTEQKMLGACSGSVLGSILAANVSRWQQFVCSVTYHTTPQNYSDITSTQGNATMKVLNLSGLTGYVQTDGASVSAPATDQELDEINAYLDSGIYIN